MEQSPQCLRHLQRTADEDADSAELPGLVLGEDAHIIARSESGPRGLDGDRNDIDGYDNLLLLCLEDHKRVDAQPAVFTVDRLRQIRTDHETWAAERFASPATPRLAAATSD